MRLHVGVTSPARSEGRSGPGQRVTPCRALVAGFGRPGMRDLDFGHQLVDYFQQLDWPDGVVVEDLSCAAPLVLHRLHELRPAKVVLVGAVPRDLDPPATLRRYQVEPSVETSAMGFVDLDHTLAMARHWGGLPVDTTVIEVEPAEASFGLGFSDALAACLDPILDMVREELAGIAVDATEACEDPLPSHESAVSGVDIAVQQRPRVAGGDRGGDWFDVVPLGDGLLGMVIGRGEGRGVEEAAAISDLRAAAKAYMLVDGDSPGRMLRHLERLKQTTGSRPQARLLYMTIRPATGEVRYANAGGCPPLLLGEGASSARVLDAGSPEGTLWLTGGATLLLYTDALVEHGTASRAAGLERLSLAARAAPHALDDLCPHVIDACTEGLAGVDDLCLLGVRLSVEHITSGASAMHVGTDAVYPLEGGAQSEGRAVPHLVGDRPDGGARLS